MSINRARLDDDQFKSSFLEGKLSIDCLEIKLTQKGASEPRVFSSPGFIWASSETGLEARLVLRRDASFPYDPFSSMKQMFSVRSGELFPDSHYYRLEATDVAGNVWTNPAVMPRFEDQDSAHILSFACDYIEAQFPAQDAGEFAHFVFADDLKFPLNTITRSEEFVRGQQRVTIKSTVSSGKVSGMETYYYRRSGDKGTEAFELVVLGVAGETVPESFDESLLEAVRFCSATMASPVMSEVLRGGQRVVRLAKAAPLNNGLLSPPLSDKGAVQDFYRLMSCYYDYAWRNAKGRDGAPLSAKLRGLFTLKGVWLETIALLLCVATEAVLDDPLFKTLGKPNASLLGTIKKLFDWVKKAPVEESLQTRALNALGSMKSNRAVDKMYALAKANAIDEAEIDSWKTLRNPAAHGSFEIDEDKLQELLDHVYRLSALIYKLAFLKIGYTGKYSDYGRRAWPTLEYDAPAVLKAIPS